MVAPFAGAWIEMFNAMKQIAKDVLSLPSRERGLKYELRDLNERIKAVAPFAGAWIEMACRLTALLRAIVAPFAGAWIEISNANYAIISTGVAPFAGAWIEIFRYLFDLFRVESLPSRERGLK